MERKFKLMVDPIQHKSKPSNSEVAKIQTRLRNEQCIKELTIKEINDIISKGHTIVLGVFKNGVKDANFIQQELIGIDVDNKEDEVEPLEHTISTLREKGIKITSYYFTFSSTDEVPRYRLIIALDKPITNLETMKFILETIVEAFPVADKACKNPSRLFYGTNGETKKVALVDAEATIKLDDIIKLNSKSITNSSNGEYKTDNELWNLIDNFDFLKYLTEEGYKLPNSTNDVLCLEDCCPICGHKDCFRFYKSTNTYFCFGSNGSKGGNIINYLMATKKLNKKEAINYFKHKLCGLPEDDPIKQKRNEDFNLIKNNLNSYSLNIVVPSTLNWLSYYEEGDKVNRTIKCPLLAEFIRNNINMVFINTVSNSKTPKYIYYKGKYNLISDNEFKALIKAFLPYDICKPKHYNEVFDLLCTDLKYISIEKMNDNENLINFENGILDLSSKKMFPHSSKLLMDIQIPCAYIENVPSPETHYFDKFLDNFTCGDEALKKLILQCIGKAISNSPGYLEKIAFLFIGPGNTGKTLFKLLLTELIGPENCSSIDLKDLEKPFSKIQLLNKRIAGTNDLSSMKISSLDSFKQLTGGDYINDAYKGMDAIDFRFKGLLILAGNKLPVFSGDRGDWVYDRMIIIPCNGVVPPEKRNNHLLKDLLTEKEYIVSLAINALYDVIKNGYDVPDVCIKLRESYKVDNNSVLAFRNECMKKRTDRFIHDDFTCGKTYITYKNWYVETHRDRYYESRSDFREIMGGDDAIVKTNNGNEYYKEWVLTEKAVNEYLDNYSSYHFEEPEPPTLEDFGLGCENNFNF